MYSTLFYDLDGGNGEIPYKDVRERVVDKMRNEQSMEYDNFHSFMGALPLNRDEATHEWKVAAGKLGIPEQQIIDSMVPYLQNSN